MPPCSVGRGSANRPRLPEQIEHVLRVLRVPVDRVGARRYLLARDPAHEVLHRELIFGQRVHRWEFLRGGRAAAKVPRQGRFALVALAA